MYDSEENAWVKGFPSSPLQLLFWHKNVISIFDILDQAVIWLSAPDVGLINRAKDRLQILLFK
jgi:hypothetical protein